MADNGFFANLRNAMKKASADLSVPSPLERPQLGPPQNQNNSNNRQTQVWGFDQDKANYGNERDASKLRWNNYTVHNNDTGEDKVIDIGYDDEGRISGVKEWNGPAYKDYYGQDMIGGFFKRNFNRDASDYTVYAAPRRDGRAVIKFDTKNQGEFIPSVVFDYHSPVYEIPTDDYSQVDGPSGKSDSEILRHWYFSHPDLKGFAGIDEEKMGAAINGSLDVGLEYAMPKTKEDWDFFEQNSDEFAGMARAFSRTPDARARRQMLQDAYEKYGKLKKFATYLEIMLEDEIAYEDGRYPEYDYTQVGKNIGDAIDLVYRSRYHHV